MKNWIKRNWDKACITGAALATSATVCRADVAFDYVTFNTILTGGLVVVGATAGAIAAIKGGVMVWGKISKYFSKAG